MGNQNVYFKSWMLEFWSGIVAAPTNHCNQADYPMFARQMGGSDRDPHRQD